MSIIVTCSTLSVYYYTEFKARCPSSQVAHSNVAEACSLQAVLGASVEVVCEAGYSGGGSATCDGGGSFSSLPTCVADSCVSTEVANSDFASVGSISGTTGDVVPVACVSGYEGSGNATCGADGFFTSVQCVLEGSCALDYAASSQKIGPKTGYFSASLDDYDYFGFAVTSLPDVDGDAVSDLVATAYSDDDAADAAGALYVLFVESSGLVRSFQKVSGSAGSLTAALAANDYFGFSACSLSGLNDDGYVTLAVGSPTQDDGGTDRGCVYVLALEASGHVHSMSRISNLVGSFTGALANSDWFGRSVANAGDLDSDGVTDLLVGTTYDDDYNTNIGSVYTLFLNATGESRSHQKISMTSGWLTAVLVSSAYFGDSVCRISDLNGDGTAEFVVGAWGEGDPSQSGAVYVLFVHSYSSRVLSHQKLSTVQGSLTAVLVATDAFGRSVAAVGDLNADGFEDVLVGAPGVDDGAYNQGAVFLVFLSASGHCLSHQRLSATAGPFEPSLSTNAEFGKAVSFLGDLNGDLIGDFLIGASHDYISGSTALGSVTVLFGTGGLYLSRACLYC